MTIVGKILVFLNFIFAAAIVYLIAQVFVTREAWRKEYEKMKNVALIAEAKYAEEKVRRENAVKAVEPQVIYEKMGADAARKETKVYTGDRAADPNAKGKYEEVVEQLAEVSKKLKAAEVNHDAVIKEIDVLRGERDVLIKQAETTRAEVLKVQKDLNDEKQKSVNNKIEADSFKQRSERMQTRVEELEKTNNQLTNQINALGPLVGKSAYSLLNPPPVPAPRDVYGTVTGVASSGITVISLGSDSGISPQNRLEVYRIDEKNPRNSVYLGELVITRTEPKQSVGQFTPKPFAKPEERLPRAEDKAKGTKGDIVSTTLGNK